MTPRPAMAIPLSVAVAERPERYRARTVADTINPRTFVSCSTAGQADSTSTTPNESQPGAGRGAEAVKGAAVPRRLRSQGSC